MKRFNSSLFLVLCLGRWADAGPDPVYLNIGTLTTPINIDAKVFINRGLISFDSLGSLIADDELFQTRNTLHFTNTGTMVAQPGFNFNAVTATGVHAASSFDSSGMILGIDSPVLGFFALGGANPPVLIPPQPAKPGINRPVPSRIVVSATNINISGTVLTGDLGLLQLNGSNIRLTGAVLGSGTISEVDTNATLGRGNLAAFYAGAGFYPFFSPPVDVYDIYWGLTNGGSSSNNVELLASDLALPPLSIVGLTFPTNTATRNSTLEGYSLLFTGFPPYFIFPMSTPFIPLPGRTPTVTTPPVAPNFVSYVYSYALDTNTTPTNVYYNIVLVNSSFADADITAQVAFSGGSLILTNGDPNGLESMIKFSAPVLDVITGQTESNSIYLLDTGAIQAPSFDSTNSIYSADDKPLAYEITRTEPAEWLSGVPANSVFDSGVLYTAGIFQNATAPMTNSFYCAQVGRNPEVPDGLFDYTATLLGHTQLGMPDITNEGARLEINAAKTLDATNLRLSANGVVKMNAPALLGAPLAMDFGNMNVDLGSVKGALVVSNLFPGAFHRLRGDIAAYSVSWVNTQTNDGLGNRVTNTIHYHLLIVDQDLRDTFQTTGLNVALRGSSVVVGDPLRVMSTALFQTANLTLNNSVHLVNAAAALQTGNLPGLKNLLIGSGGSVAADNFIDIGVVPSAGPVKPTRQNTPILTITNLGQVSSGQIELQTQLYANGGTNVCTNNGSMVINAITNFLGAGALGLTNALAADVDINLTSASIQVTNSRISAGRAGNGRLVLYASSELTDHLPNTASTGAYSTNFWQVTGGFSLPVKPVSGDLFGTQIKTIGAIGNQRIDHLWAGQDLGPTVAGFFNNQVIGHLILDRTTNATLRFLAAGRKNAMYVDFLELQDLAFSDYHNGLMIDSNLTIYFASANVEPGKLHSAYSNLVWVPQFAGPNSTTNVSYVGGSNCLMNAALAASSSQDSDGDGFPNLNDPFPLDNPIVGPIPCPALVSSTQSLSVANGVSGQTFVIWTAGQGTVTPNLSQPGVQAGQIITLKAVPASGWLFLGWSGAVVSSLPAITFPVPARPFSFLTANFITNPFIGLAGVYNGLFSPAGGVAGNNSGFVTFTLNSHGVFSGKLRFGATNYPFSSQFNIASFARLSATNGANVLALSLQFTNTALPGLATGSVTNANFQASLAAWQAPVWTASHPAPQAGSYTLVLPGNANAAASPGGDSYGTVTVDSLGNLRAIGTLADNVSFSQSVPASKGGQWPLYFTPAGAPQPLLGVVAFDTNGSGGRPAGFSGTVTWVKAAGPGAFYPNGFTNSSVLLGSIYSAAFQRTNGLGLTSPTITLSGGNLAADVTAPVSSHGLQTYQTADKSLTLTINAASGGFSGQYVAPGTSKKVPLAGVVLQNAGVARGFFLGTSQSGAVLLQGN